MAILKGFWVSPFARPAGIIYTLFFSSISWNEGVLLLLSSPICCCWAAKHETKNQNNIKEDEGSCSNYTCIVKPSFTQVRGGTTLNETFAASFGYERRTSLEGIRCFSLEGQPRGHMVRAAALTFPPSTAPPRRPGPGAPRSSYAHMCVPTTCCGVIRKNIAKFHCGNEEALAVSFD